MEKDAGAGGGAAGSAASPAGPGSASSSANTGTSNGEGSGSADPAADPNAYPNNLDPNRVIPHVWFRTQRKKCKQKKDGTCKTEKPLTFASIVKSLLPKKPVSHIVAGLQVPDSIVEHYKTGQVVPHDHPAREHAAKFVADVWRKNQAEGRRLSDKLLGIGEGGKVTNPQARPNYSTIKSEDYFRDLAKSKNVREQRKKVFGGAKTKPGSPQREKQMRTLTDYAEKRFNVKVRRAKGKESAAGKMIDKPDLTTGYVEHIGNPDSLAHELAHLDLSPENVAMKQFQEMMDAEWGAQNVKFGYKQQARAKDEYESTARENQIRRQLGLPAHAKERGVKKPGQEMAVDRPDVQIARKLPSGKYIAGGSEVITPESRQMLEDRESSGAKYHPKTGWRTEPSIHSAINLRGQGRMDEARAKAERYFRSKLRKSEFHFEDLSKSTPNNKIRQVADQYAKVKGFTLNHEAPKATVNQDFAKKVAQAYHDMPHNPNDPATKKAYDSLINETVDQFNHLKNSGLKISAIAPNQENPYKSSNDLFHDVNNNNHMWYFPTEGGFGSSDVQHSDHPMLRPTGIKHGGRELLANDVFRIVHDYFGHAKEGHRFSASGEENAWKHHMQMYSPEAQKALTTETRGQNSWVNFGPHGESNRANPANTVYADQKAGLLPDWAHAEHAPAQPIKKSNPAYLEHYSVKRGLKEITPHHMGTGAPSAEYKRGLPEVPRSYYYIGGTKPEDIVHQGAVAKYRVMMPHDHKLYDLAKDPDGHVRQAVQDNNGAWNSDMILGRIKSAGYHGYTNSSSPLPNVVAMFHPMKVHTEEKP